MASYHQGHSAPVVIWAAMGLINCFDSMALLAMVNTIVIEIMHILRVVYFLTFPSFLVILVTLSL